MLWSDLIVSLSSKTWPASRDVSKKACGVCGYARKNSHKLVGSCHKSKGLYRAKEYESDVLDKTLSQFYAFRISLILPSMLLVP